MNHLGDKEFIGENNDDDNNGNDDNDKEARFITIITTSNHCTTFRNTLEQTMFSGWKARFRQWWLLVCIM